MRRIIGPVLFLFLVLEVTAAVLIVMAQPDGFGSLVAFDIGPERRQDQAPQTFNIPNGASGTISVDSDNGRVEIIGDPNATQVLVKATKVVHSNSDNAFNRLTFSAQQNGNDIVIQAKRNGPSVGFFGSDRVDVTVTTPANMVANINGNNGTINVTGLNNSTGRLHVGTNNGRVTLSQITANYLELNSDNGEINLNGVNGTINAETSNGRIVAANSTLNIERLKSNNGTIDVSGKLNQTANGSVETDNGSVRLRMEQGNMARYDVTTDNGSINFRLAGVNFQQQDRKHYVTSGNGPLIRIQTDNGSVTVE